MERCKPGIVEGPGLLDRLKDQELLYTGRVMLGKDILVDIEMLDIDPFQGILSVCDA